jgi:hypothetical protein
MRPVLSTFGTAHARAVCPVHDGQVMDRGRNDETEVGSAHLRHQEFEEAAT